VYRGWKGNWEKFCGKGEVFLSRMKGKKAGKVVILIAKGVLSV